MKVEALGGTKQKLRNEGNNIRGKRNYDKNNKKDGD